MIIKKENQTKFTSYGSNIGALGGLAYGIANGIKNKNVLKDTFETCTKTNMPKPLKIGGYIAGIILGLGACAFGGSILGEITGSLTEKITNLFKKND